MSRSTPAQPAPRSGCARRAAAHWQVCGGVTWVTRGRGRPTWVAAAQGRRTRMHPTVTETAPREVVHATGQGLDLVRPDVFGQTRRSAALVLFLAVLIGAAGVGAA